MRVRSSGECERQSWWVCACMQLLGTFSVLLDFCCARSEDGAGENPLTVCVASILLAIDGCVGELIHSMERGSEAPERSIGSL